MVLSRNFHPFRVLSYVRTEVIFSVLAVSAVYLILKFRLADVSFSISAILGSALAIFTAFRNNTRLLKIVGRQNCMGKYYQQFQDFCQSSVHMH